MFADHSKPTADAGKGKENATSGEQPPSAPPASSSTEELSTQSTIKYQKEGQERRMRAMHQRIVSACTTASHDKLPVRSVPPRQLNSTWGGKSAWGIPTDTENVALQQGESPDNENSIHAWAASSTRVRFSTWGSAGERSPSQRPDSLELKTLVTSPLLSSFPGDVGTMAMANADQIATAIFQAASSATTVPQQSQLVVGVGIVSELMLGDNMQHFTSLV